MSTVTITDVAKHVGVSVATISRYLSGFTVRNQEQIREAIIEYVNIFYYINFEFIRIVCFLYIVL